MASASEYDDPDPGSNSADGSRISRERDEIVEVKKMSSAETNRVRVWRTLVTLCLVCSGVVITLTTYRFLEDEQVKNFEVAVRYINYRSSIVVQVDYSHQKQCRAALAILTLVVKFMDMAPVPTVLADLKRFCGKIFLAFPAQHCTMWSYYIALSHSSVASRSQPISWIADQLSQQRSIREGFKAFADAITLTAIRSNETWPFVTLPFFEAQARHFRNQIGAEVVGLVVKVQETQKEEWLSFANRNHDNMVREGHLIQKGSFERLSPVGYHNFISKVDPQTGEFVPQTISDEYMPLWQYTPPPATYGLINLDYYSVEHFGKTLLSLLSVSTTFSSF